MATTLPTTVAPRVFISYSHDTTQHEATVLDLADRLRQDGIDANLDQYEPAPSDGWPLWMEKQIKQSDFVLMVCTPIYYQRILKECAANSGRGVCWEANLIYQLLYEQKVTNERFLPLLLSGEDPTSIPLPLRGVTRYNLLDQDGYASLYRTLTRQNVAKPALGTLKPLPQRHRNTPPGMFILSNPKEQPHSLHPQVVTLTTLSPNFPAPQSKELGRDHVIHTIQSLLGRDIDVVAIEGDEGIGKTTLLSQFARSLPMNAISIFLRSADRYSYDPENVQRSLANQLNLIITNEPGRKADGGGHDLSCLFTELQRRAKRNATYYFLIDGLTELPEHASGTLQRILELVPIGWEGFKFVVTGDAALFAKHLPSTVSVKSFPLIEFSLDDTIKYLADIVVDRDVLELLHTRCKGHPGTLAQVRRIATSGTDILLCIQQLSFKNPDLALLEWQQVGLNHSLLRKCLAILAHDDKAHTPESLSALLGVDESEVSTIIANLSFLTVMPDTHRIQFVSEPLRRYTTDQLRTLKNWVHKANIKQLMRRPDSTEAILELPLHLSEAAEFQTLVQYLTPQHILEMLRRSQSLARVQATVEVGLTSAKRLERDGDMLRFGIEKSLLLQFLSSGVGIAEAEALVSLGDYSAATAVANAALLREDRLQILATIAKGKRIKGHAVEPQLLEQIRVLLKQVDAKAMGKRAIDIAAQLICVEPELALTLVDQAKPSDIEKDRAMARLSVLTLEALGKERSHQALDRIKARGFEDKVDLLQTSLAALSGKWSMEELYSNIEKIAKSKDKLFIIQSWLRVNRRSGRLTDAVKHALELAIRMTDSHLDATVLHQLAEPLYNVADSAGLADLVGMFDAQMAGAARLGPSVAYIRLQIALARCETRFDRAACENRLIGLFYELGQLTDVGVRAEGWAWLLDGISEMQASSPYGTEFDIGKDVNSELETTFLALLDGTADHYRAASGVIKALTIRHFDKALDFASMLNTQSRRDRSFADVIETLFEERGGRQCSADQVQRVLAKIDDRFLRDDALYEAIQSIESLERDEILIDDQFRTFLLSSYDIASADARCLACAKAYLILVKISKKEWRSASDALVECIETSWNAIDVPAVRIAVGFEIAQILAPISAELSALYLERTEEVRAGIGGLTNANADHAYSLCLQLAIRAFTGLVPKRCHSRQDLERLAVLIGYTPSAGHRALLWADLALRCAVQGDDHLCSEIVSERVRPILSSLSDTDVENSTFVTSRCAPALYAANRTVAMGIVDRLELPYRDEAYYGIIRYLFRNESPYEPEEYIPGSGYEAEYSNLVELCDLTKHLDSDALIYEVIERTIDCLTSKTVTVAYNTAQREEVYRRVQDIVKTKLPAPRHIRHEGYKVIARAQLARFRNDPDLDDLVASAERIPNTADRALVMFTTGLAVGKTARNTADRLLTTAQELVGEIPADWDRLERMIGFAYQAKPYNKALSRKMLEAAVRVVPNLAEGRNRSVRNIVDLAHKIDPAFAKELVEKFDDDRVRVRAKREVQLLDLKDRVAGEKSVYEELQAASAAEYRKIGTMLLASLQSDRNIKAQTIRPCIQTVGGHPITEAFAVLSWIIQNTVDKHASSTKAAYYLRPLFEATLAGVELAGCLASRSFDEFKATQEQYESMAERNADSEAFGKEEAIGFLRSWLDDNTGESVAICDAAFTPEDLLIVQMIRAVNPECRIEILTCKPSALPPEGMSWEDVYTSQWRNLSDQPPPPTRITMISSTAASECPIKAAWLISGDVGLEVGRTLSGLGSNDSMTFKSMDVHEVETLRQDVQKLLTGGIEWAGARIRFSSFSI